MPNTMTINDAPNPPMHEQDNNNNEELTTGQKIAERIIHVLTIYPKLSHSMLQVGLGTTLPPIRWRPILEQMLAEGKVVEHKMSTMSPQGRYQTYSILSLADVKADGANAPLETAAAT